MAQVLQFRKSGYSTWEEALSSFLLLRKALGNSPRTVRDYKDHVGSFFKASPEVWETDSWEGKRLRDCVLAYMGRQKSPATFNLRLTSLKLFFDWAAKEGVLSTNPTEGLRQRKASPRIVNIPEETLSKLLSLPDRSTYAGLRDYCLILLQLDSGIRPGEALSLKVEDIDFRGFTVTVRSVVSKTRTTRTLFLSLATVRALKELIAARPEEWGNAPVFCTYQGRPFPCTEWNFRIRERYLPRLGAKVTPYMLRHAFALGFLRNEGNLIALQRIMGHTTLEMTRRYLALTDGDLREASAKASPLNNILKSANTKRVRKIGKE